MGFFDFVFGSKPKKIGQDQPKEPEVKEEQAEERRYRFTKTSQLHADLFHELKSVLSEAQMKKIEALLGRYMSGGGVTRGEIETWIVRDLRKLRDAGELSRFEYEAGVKALRLS